MTHPPAPTPEEFEKRFRDDIRVGLNWERFLAEQWPVERVTLSSKDDLDRCFTPWYVGMVAEELPYDDPRAAPMNLTDVRKAFEILSVERKADIQEKLFQFVKEQSQVKFTAPTYALPDDRYFILDKNHRLSALVLSHKSFEVELWNIRGPFEKECLLDLHHWLKDNE